MQSGGEFRNHFSIGPGLDSRRDGAQRVVGHDSTLLKLGGCWDGEGGADEAESREDGGGIHGENEGDGNIIWKSSDSLRQALDDARKYKEESTR